MLRIRSINSVAIAYFFLASIMVVYGTYIVCSTDLFSHIITEHSHSEDHHNVEDSGHQSHSHEHEGESSTDDCCEDFTYSFFNDAKLLTKQLLVEFEPLNALTVFQKITHSLEVVELSTDTPQYVEPPPQAVHIRILNQTFLI